MHSLNSNEIKHQAIGNWPAIISNLAPHLSNAVEKLGKHVACPIHGGKDGFRLYKDFPETGAAICNSCGSFSDGFALLIWANDWSFIDALKAVDEYLDSDTCINSIQKPHIKPNSSTSHLSQVSNIRKKNAINLTLSKCKKQNDALSNYLRNRGLQAFANSIPSDLNAVDSLPYWHDGKEHGSFPAMIGIVRNLAGEIVTLHRTYLTTKGFKANVPAPKKLMTPSIAGATTGCAIQLYKATNKLAITEGIETALAVHLMTGLPVWAAISSTLLEKVEIPHDVQEVFIMADKDISGAGEHSAMRLARRLSENHKVKIVLPKLPIASGHKSIDWLDVYNNEQAIKSNLCEVSL